MDGLRAAVEQDHVKTHDHAAVAAGKGRELAVEQLGQRADRNLLGQAVANEQRLAPRELLLICFLPPVAPEEAVDCLAVVCGEEDGPLGRVRGGERRIDLLDAQGRLRSHREEGRQGDTEGEAEHAVAYVVSRRSDATCSGGPIDVRSCPDCNRM